MDPSALAPGSSGDESGSGRGTRLLPQLSDWVMWVQAGLTALLAVLFVAMLMRAREQGVRIQELQERVQGLENSRALESTTGLEEQLRTTVERLQAVERDSSRIEVLRAETEALRAQVRELSMAVSGPSPRRSAAPAPLPSGAGPGAEAGPAEPARPEADVSPTVPSGSAQP